MNKNELLKETTCITNHLPLLCEFVLRAIEISGMMGENCAKKRPSILSSEKGKSKVSRGNKRPRKSRIKGTPNYQTPTIANSHDQSPIEVNFKRAHYDYPNHSDDSNMRDVTRFEDFPIMDLDTSTS